MRSMRQVAQFLPRYVGSVAAIAPRPDCRGIFWIIVIYLAMALYGESVFWYFHLKDMTPSYQQTNLKVGISVAKRIPAILLRFHL